MKQTQYQTHTWVGHRQGAELEGGGGFSPPSFGDLFSKFWEFFENMFFAIYCSPPPIKNLLPPTLVIGNASII